MRAILLLALAPAGAASPPGEATFENLAHDFPQRVIYRRCGKDLRAHIEGVVNGTPQSQEWRYVRAR